MLADLRAHLLADTTVKGLIGTRMFPTKLPQKAAYPALTYSQVSGTRLRNLCATVHTRPRISISSWGKTYAAVHALADAVKASIMDYRGSMGGTVIGDVSLDNQFDLYEDEAEVYRVVQDYIFSYAED